MKKTLIISFLCMLIPSICWAACTGSSPTWTAARSNWPVGAHDTALDPGFVSAATGNFAIGTNLKAQGYPGAFQLGSTGYTDIGAVQRKEPTLATGF